MPAFLASFFVLNLLMSPDLAMITARTISYGAHLGEMQPGETASCRM